MTFSIIGRDTVSGHIGVALASYYYGCVPRTLLASPGVGIVVMQMVPEMDYGTSGIKRMANGENPAAILADLSAQDGLKAMRQVAMMRSDGEMAVFTGSGCIPVSGHMEGRDCCAQGAMVAGQNVWQDAVQEFEASKGPLAERLISAMRGGEAAGGDIRGRRAAGMIIVSDTCHSSWVESRPVDIRVDDHADPLGEIGRHLEIQRHMGAIELAFERGLRGDIARAVEDYAMIASRTPDDPDVTMRYAIMLASSGRIAEAAQQLRRMASVHEGWAQVIERLTAAGLLPDHPLIREVSDHRQG